MIKCVGIVLPTHTKEDWWNTYQASQSSQCSIGHTQVTRKNTFYLFIAMIGVNISRKPLEIIFLATVFSTFMNNHNYRVVAQSKICTSYQCFLGLTNANQLDAVSLNNWSSTLRFFFKFVSRANNSNNYPQTKWPRKQKDLALEKFLEQTTLKPCDFWAGEALKAQRRDCRNIKLTHNTVNCWKKMQKSWILTLMVSN